MRGGGEGGRAAQHITIAPSQVAHATREGLRRLGRGYPPQVSSLHSTRSITCALTSTQYSTRTVKAPVREIAAKRMGRGPCKAAWTETVRGCVGSTTATKAAKGAFAKATREGRRSGKHVRAGRGGFCRDPGDRAPSWKERARSGAWHGEGKGSARAAAGRDRT